MKLFIAGVAGYLGCALASRRAERGDEISGADRFLRRAWVEEMGSGSIVPIASMSERIEAFRARFGRDLRFFEGDLCDYAFVRDALADVRPDAVVHLGEMPSAPYSMIDVDAELGRVLDDLAGCRDEILRRQSVFVPDIRWNGARRPVAAQPVADDAPGQDR